MITRLHRARWCDAITWIALAACTSRSEPAAGVPTTTIAGDGESTSDPSASDDAADASDQTPEEPPHPADFLMRPDQAGVGFECDLFSQDCPLGDKCMPWANNGGAAWNSTRCSPIADDPGAEGDACAVEGSGASGIDDCDIRLMCWNVDETGTGYCENMCIGSADNPFCEDPHQVCSISSAPFSLCLDACDPLAQDCTEMNHACYPYNNAWTCAPDASGELGAYGDPCEYISACDEGLVCMGAAAFTECPGAQGCCSALCNVDDETADASCAALDVAQVCVRWYQPGLAPSGLGALGVCARP